jgi:phosphohistidine swiveling domain-containing protein
VASGRAYTDINAALDAADEGEDIILVRAPTSPDDVQGMIAARGIINETGGATSHAAVVSGEIGGPLWWGVAMGWCKRSMGYQLHVQYMARAIQEDAPAASTFVDAMVEESEAIFGARAAAGTRRPSSDPRALAVLNLLLGLAVPTMAPPLTRSLGYQRLGPDVLRRIAVPSFDLYTHGLYTDNALPQTTQDAEAAAPQPQQK